MKATPWDSTSNIQAMVDHLSRYNLLDLRKLRLWVSAMIGVSDYPYQDPNRIIPNWKKGEFHKFEGSPLGTARIWCNSEADNPGDPPMSVRADILRDLMENPIRATSIFKSSNGHFYDASITSGDGQIHWITPQVISLAQAAFDVIAEKGTQLDSVRLAVLADALEESGMPTTIECPECQGTGRLEDDGDGEGWICAKTVTHPLLQHLRSPKAHYRGCWAVDIFLGYGGCSDACLDLLPESSKGTWLATYSDP